MSQQPVRIPIVHLPDNPELTAQVAAAFGAARAAQPAWARLPVAQRLERVRALRHLIAENGQQLAEASAQARSRPVGEAFTAEVLPLAEACRFLEREAEALLAPRRQGRWRRPLWLAGVRSEIQREPFGVVLVIGPGNYPLFLPGVQLLQALVAGNAAVLKPGVGGTAAAEAWLSLLVRAGFPEHLVARLPEATAAAHAAILARPDTVVFTGSARVGEAILAQLAPQVIPATMELSGCDAVVVCADADLDLAAKALAFGLRLNGGATCMAPKRVFVARSVAGELEARLASLLQKGQRIPPTEKSCVEPQNPLTRPAGTLSPSDGERDGVRGFVGTPQQRLAPGNLCRFPTPFSTAQGSPAQSLLTSAATRVEEALASGAHVLAGEIRAEGRLSLPLVLAEVCPQAQLLQEDFFLPILALVTVKDEWEAVLQANTCPFALAASVFSRDEAKARAVAARLKAGVVTLNDLIVPTADPRLPLGGRQRSGFGVTRGAEGLLELTRPKVVTVSRGRFRPAYERAEPGDENLFQAYLALAHGRGWRRRWGALSTLVRRLSHKRRSLVKEL